MSSSNSSLNTIWLQSVRNTKATWSFRMRISETTDKSVKFSWPQRFIRDGVIARQVWPSDKEDIR